MIMTVVKKSGWSCKEDVAQDDDDDGRNFIWNVAQFESWWCGCDDE